MRIGNSRGLVFPQPVLEMLDWDEDEEIEFQVEGRRLILTPVKRERTKKRAAPAHDESI